VTVTPATTWWPRGPGVDRVLWGGRIATGLALRLLAVLTIGFVLFRLLPGDPVAAITRGRPTTPEQRAALRAQFGLDRPLPVQFADYLGDVLRGDLGTSFVTRRPVVDVVAERLWPTLLLVGLGTALAVLLGGYTGAVAGWRAGGRFDRSATAVALALWATPAFWLGLLLLVVLGAGAGPLPALFPAGGLQSPGTDVPPVLDVARHLLLPCLTLVAVQFGQYHLLMRASVRDERALPYVTTARATGLRDAEVRRRHVLPNAARPTATLALLNAGYVLSGAVAVEAVFSWPGLGYLSWEALRLNDLPVLHGTFLVFSVAVVAANTVAARISG
jgi:peptide/nickel transport system permease protein